MARPTLRPARAEDAPTIRRLVRAARLDPTQLHWPQFLVAEAEGQIVGIGQLRRYGSVQELGSLVVTASWQRGGLGGTLVQALIERRDAPLFLECRGALAPYYQRFGFQRIPWQVVPWPLRAKFALSVLLARLVRQEVATMRFSELPP